MSAARSRIVTSPSPPCAVAGDEADAVVAHRQHHPLALARQAHRHLIGTRMARHVGERFLRDAVEVQLVVGRQQAPDRDRRQAQRQAVAMRELLRVRAHRVLEPEAEELGGVVVAHDAGDRLGDLADARVRGCERGTNLLGHRAGRALEAVQQDADGGDRLSDVIVQLARDALALGFERLQDPLREGLLRRLHLLALGDVAHHPEQIELVADVDARHADLDREHQAVLAFADGLELRTRARCHGADEVAKAPRRKLGVDVRDDHVRHFFRSVATEAAGALVHVEETAVGVDEVERVVRHVRHLTEHADVERGGEGSRRLLRAGGGHQGTLRPPALTGQANPTSRW